MDFKIDVKVNTKLMNKVFKSMEQLAVKGIQVGVVGEAATRPSDNGRLTQGENAAIQELGTLDGHVPAHHFVGDAVRKNRSAVSKMLKEMIVKALGRDASTSGVGGVAAADETGKALAEMVKSFILDSRVRPLNAPATRAKKGPLPVLVDSMSLVDAIGHRVIRMSGEVLESGADAGYQGFEYSGEDEEG